MGTGSWGRLHLNQGGVDPRGELLSCPDEGRTRGRSGAPWDLVGQRPRVERPWPSSTPSHPPRRVSGAGARRGYGTRVRDRRPRTPQITGDREDDVGSFLSPSLVDVSGIGERFREVLKRVESVFLFWVVLKKGDEGQNVIWC